MTLLREQGSLDKNDVFEQLYHQFLCKWYESCMYHANLSTPLRASSHDFLAKYLLIYHHLWSVTSSLPFSMTPKLFPVVNCYYYIFKLIIIDLIVCVTT